MSAFITKVDSLTPHQTTTPIQNESYRRKIQNHNPDMAHKQTTACAHGCLLAHKHPHSLHEKPGCVSSHKGRVRVQGSGRSGTYPSVPWYCYAHTQDKSICYNDNLRRQSLLLFNPLVFRGLLDYRPISFYFYQIIHDIIFFYKHHHKLSEIVFFYAGRWHMLFT